MHLLFQQLVTLLTAGAASVRGPGADQVANLRLTLIHT